MPSEYFSLLRERLEAAGALDVSLLALQMKKNRPGVEVRVLCSAGHSSKMTDILLENSTTFGVRKEWVMREVLPRTFKKVNTPWGEVKVKVSELEGKVKQHIEYEDVATLCREHDLSWMTITDWIKNNL